MVAVQPDTQMVEWIVAWVTAGLSAPGVRLGSGSPGRRSAEGAPSGGSTPVALAANEAPALAPGSSSPSWPDATDEAVVLVAWVGVVLATASSEADTTGVGVAAEGRCPTT